MLLLNRPLLSILGAVYGFAGRPEAHVVQDLPKGVQVELGMMSCLLVCTVCDLGREWAPELVASVAAQSWVFGGARIRCGPDWCRRVAAHVGATEHEVHTLVDGEVVERTQVRGRVLRLPFRKSDFTVTFSIRAKERGDAVVMEAVACEHLLRQIFRHRGWQERRIALLVDSLAVSFALRKGRSSAAGLTGPLRSMGALLLAGGAKLHTGYIPSEFNPADEPSRGVVRRHRGRRAVERGLAYPSRGSVLGAGRSMLRQKPSSQGMEQHFAKHRRAERALRASGMLESRGASSWNSASSATSRGQPASTRASWDSCSS
jgi:hypothetical protein